MEFKEFQMQKQYFQMQKQYPFLQREHFENRGWGEILWEHVKRW